jgi:hypothetical protein
MIRRKASDRTRLDSASSFMNGSFLQLISATLESELTICFACGQDDRPSSNRSGHRRAHPLWIDVLPTLCHPLRHRASRTAELPLRPHTRHFISKDGLSYSLRSPLSLPAEMLISLFFPLSSSLSFLRSANVDARLRRHPNPFHHPRSSSLAFALEPPLPPAGRQVRSIETFSVWACAEVF